MANFCTRCGRPLQQGEMCTCSSEVSAQATGSENHSNYNEINNGGANPTKNAVPNVQSQYIKEIAELLRRLAKSPVQAGKEFILKANVKIAIVFIVLQGILSGLYGIFVASKLVNTYAGGYGISQYLRIPYLLSFVITVIISILFTFIMAVLLLGAYRVSKYQITFHQVIAQVSLRSIIVSCMTILAIIFTLINMIFGVFFFLLGSLGGIMIICLTIPSQFDNGKIFYALFVAFILFSIIAGIIVSMSYTVYLPSSMHLNGLSSLLF